MRFVSKRLINASPPTSGTRVRHLDLHAPNDTLSEMLLLVVQGHALNTVLVPPTVRTPATLSSIACQHGAREGGGREIAADEKSTVEKAGQTANGTCRGYY